MGPAPMSILIFVAFALFAWSASRRWQLLQIGRADSRLDHIPQRLAGTWRFAFRQEKMDYYNPAGIAHKLIFAGFVVLLFRTLILWGRGFYAPFGLWVLGPAQPLGQLYEFAKDTFGVLVVAGTLVFFYYRLVAKPKRMALSLEGLLIIGIIFTMMIADMTYDGATLALTAQQQGLCDAATRVASAGQCAAIHTLTAPYDLGAERWDGLWAIWPSPAGSLFAVLLHTLSPGALVFMARLGFWTHATLVLLFLNLLPHSKHFHVITAVPNVFARSLRPAGRLAPMAENTEKLMETFGGVAEASDPLAPAFGVARMEHFTWKSILDFYTCTECGRCSDNCPAHRTGKILSPKHLTLALRDNLYAREEEILHHTAHGKASAQPPADAPAANGEAAASPSKNGASNGLKPINLVPEVIHPDVLWACTTCRACEEQCPVLISYVDKIIDMRRSLVMVRNEFPHELGRPFNAMESNGNPWNLSRVDRAAWSDGLGVPMMAEKPTAPVLFWVGCAASYDERAKKIARATAKLLKQAEVDFAILGQEETCTGDPARRAGNEILFASLAETNAATINGYKEQGGVRTVVTTCPHCFNTLKNEYPDFGLQVEVVHHTDYLLGLLAEGRLVPQQVGQIPSRVVYHDSCYLGRYNGVYDPPREILKRIPGVELVEPEYWTKQRGLCCGAGGAQMWMEEQNQDRVNVKRTLQLVDALGVAQGNGTNGGGESAAGPDGERSRSEKTIASACPFCMTMLTDGIKSKSLEDHVKQLDVAELLERACAVDERSVGTVVIREAGEAPAETPVENAPEQGETSA